MTVTELAAAEETRARLQVELDQQKTQGQRNELGQFATPRALADSIIDLALPHLPEGESIRFIDPAFGLGSFYSALLRRADRPIENAVGYELDPHYGEHAKDLWSPFGLEIHLEDFTKQLLLDARRFNLVVSNPPYVRHHHLTAEEKAYLQKSVKEASGVHIQKLAGLYAHFMLLCHQWMEAGGVAVWLIPSEFLDVNYGAALREYLTDRVKLLRLHRFDPNDVQFDDALVSSTVVLFEKSRAARDHEVQLSSGGTLEVPRHSRFATIEALSKSSKWTQVIHGNEIADAHSPRLSDFFDVRRGLATGKNEFFILSEAKMQELGIPRKYFRPILPSPRVLGTEQIASDETGMPLIEKRLLLLDCQLVPEEAEKASPELWRYLATGVESGVAETYLCSHRKVWYYQERRPAAPYLCTYIGRSDKEGHRTFRFILNDSDATATNNYHLMYPKGAIADAIKMDASFRERVWEQLNAISGEQMVASGRVYGGGMHKLEPKELANIPLPEFVELEEEATQILATQQSYAAAS